MTMESTGAVGTDTSVSRVASGEHPQPVSVLPGQRLRPERPRRTQPGSGHTTALVAADCLAAAGAAAVTGAMPGAVLGLVPALLTLVALHAQGGLYRVRPLASALEELPRLLWHAALAWSVATTVVAVLRPEASLGWKVPVALIAAHVLLASPARGAVHWARVRRNRRHPRSALVVGTGQEGRRVTGILYEHPEYGMRPVGLVGAPEETVVSPFPVPVLSSTEDITRAVIQNSVRDAVFPRNVAGDPHGAALVRLFTELGCTVWLLNGEPAPAGAVWRASDDGHVWGFACLRLEPAPRRRLAHVGKRALDIAGAAFALVLAAPVLALCALAVRAADGPGVIFRQERIGVAGRPFVMLKFRTLRPTDAHESATCWNVAGDRRMSTVGSLLRRTSLDELPQLWNVLRGDMSLVGPRPERPFFVKEFSNAHPGYAARARMPAGITGLAQVHGLRGDTSIEDRARFDNHYIETWSLWRDVQILVRTAGSVFRLGGS